VKNPRKDVALFRNSYTTAASWCIVETLV